MTGPHFNNSPASNLLAELGLDAKPSARAVVERYGKGMRDAGHRDALLHLRGEVHDAACGGDGLTGVPPSDAEMVAFEYVVALIDKHLARGPLPESCAQTQIDRANHALYTAGEQHNPSTCPERVDPWSCPCEPEKSEQRGEDERVHDSAELIDVATEIMLHCNEASECPLCGIDDGDHEPGEPCDRLDVALLGPHDRIRRGDAP